MRCLLLPITLLLVACDDGGSSTPADARADVAPSDARADTGPPRDALPADARFPDVAPPDAAPLDAAPPDAAPDSAPPDAAIDAAPPDAAPPPPLPIRAPLTAPPDPLADAAVESCATYEATACVDGRALRCALYDPAAASFVEPDPLLQRVLRAERRYDRYHQPDGQTAQRVFDQAMPPGTPEDLWGDPAHFHRYAGAGDAAIWTGVALDAYALRYATTGTEADYARMERKVRQLLALFDVTGVPGYLARHHWGQIDPGPSPTPDHIVDHRDTDHRDHVFPLDRLEDAPAAYAAPGVTPMWHGNPSIDQYTGPMVSFPLVYGLLRDDALKARIATHITCYLKRLDRIEVRNVQANPDVLGALQAFLGGGRLALDPGDIDLTAVDTAVGYVLRQLNEASADDLDLGCPAEVALEPSRVIDLTDNLFLARLLELASDLMSRDSARPWGIDHFYGPNIRGGDAVHLMHLAAMASWFTDDPQYRRFFHDELVGRLQTLRVAATAGALDVPDWCRAFFGGHITYPAFWSLINLLDDPALTDPLRAAMHTEFELRERGNLDDLKFDLMYAATAPAEHAAAAEAARARARATFAVLGGNGGVLDDPRRSYALPADRVLAEWPADTALRCPSPDERAACEDGVALLGARIPGEPITRPCTGGPAECVLDDGACADALADAPLPPPLRGFTDFLWQRSPFDVGHGGNGGYEQSPGLDLIEPYWLARHTGVITEGEGLVLAWEDTGACEE